MKNRRDGGDDGWGAREEMRKRNWNLPLSASRLDSLLAIGHYWRMGSQ